MKLPYSSALRYKWSTRTLKPLLPSFIGGQFRLAKLSTEDEQRKRILMTFHGKVGSIYQPDMRLKRVVIVLEWLRERHFVFDTDEKLQPKWVLVSPPPSGVQNLTVDFVVFYTQPNTNDRLKFKGWSGEFCRLYHPDDPACLIESDDGLVQSTSSSK